MASITDDKIKLKTLPWTLFSITAGIHSRTFIQVAGSFRSGSRIYFYDNSLNQPPRIYIHNHIKDDKINVFLQNIKVDYDKKLHDACFVVK